MLNDIGFGCCFGLQYSCWYLTHHTLEQVQAQKQCDLAELHRLLREYGVETGDE